MSGGVDPFAGDARRRIALAAALLSLIALGLALATLWETYR
ncbi:hypothetical protein V5F89_12325 [Pelagerythrobacter marensis]|uniref:Uncharacterized protein n=1 Tax=Pelagerythrobacter marensis TaxID=543877 RepID=A0ABZ2D1X3_9SPHN